MPAPSMHAIILGLVALVLLGILITVGITSTRVLHCEDKKSTSFVAAPTQLQARPHAHPQAHTPGKASWLQTAMAQVMPASATQ